MDKQGLARLERIVETGFNTLADLQGETNRKLDDLKGEVQGLKGEVQHLKQEVHGLNGRFDNFLTGVHRKDHEELRGRIERIEHHLGFGLPG